MRVSAHVLVAYLTLLAIGALWRFLPFGRVAPEVAAMFAVYLGMTARGRLSGAVVGALVVGYFADLLSGAPIGISSATCGLITVFGHVVQRRILIRGLVMTAMSAVFIGCCAGILSLLLRLYFGWVPGSVASEFVAILGSGAVTGVVGPLVLWMCRRIDGHFRVRPNLSVAPSGLSS